MGVLNCSNDSSDSHALRASERATRILSGIVQLSVECEKPFPSWNFTRAYYAQIDPRLRPLDEVRDNRVVDHVVVPVHWRDPIPWRRVNGTQETP